MFNVKKCKDSPASLSDKKKYDGEDVFTQLRADFHDKCYICETKQPLSINIEHFISHRNKSEELKFSWDNLYFSCGRCNGIKNIHFDNILDCCDPHSNIYEHLRLTPPRMPYESELSISVKIKSFEADETVNLLKEVFNGDSTTNKKISSEFLRQQVFKQMNKLYTHVLTWYSEDSLESQKAESLEKMKLYIKPSSPYSAFMRELIDSDEKLKYLLD